MDYEGSGSDENPTTTSPEPCPVGWDPVAGECLKVYDETKNWADARASCVEEGANLAIVKNQDQRRRFL